MACNGLQFLTVTFNHKNNKRLLKSLYQPKGLFSGKCSPLILI